MRSHRRFAGAVAFPHLCCFRCSICRWFRLGEGMGRIANSDKSAIGERWYLTGEWRLQVELWKGNEGIVGAAESGLADLRSTPASLSENETSCPCGSLSQPLSQPGRAQDAALIKQASPREGLRTLQVRPKVTPTAG